MPNNEVILAKMQPHAIYSIKDLSELTGFEKDSTARSLYSLVRDGKVGRQTIKRRQGVYAIPLYFLVENEEGRDIHPSNCKYYNNKIYKMCCIKCLFYPGGCIAQHFWPCDNITGRMARALSNIQL